MAGVRSEMSSAKLLQAPGMGELLVHVVKMAANINIKRFGSTVLAAYRTNPATIKGSN